MSDPNEPIQFSQLLADLGVPQGAEDGIQRVHVTPDWMQGRTLYGGISAALCLKAARNDHPDLPPLRSALISFVGPAAGDVAISTQMLRQGKSASFVAVDLRSEAGHGTHATFCFGADRVSSQRQSRLPMPDLTPPAGAPPHFAPDRPRPSFIQHFDMRIAEGSPPVSGASEADMKLWLKLREGDVHPMEASLLALADAPPPAALSLYSTFTPLSTMTWMVDFLSTDLTSPDQWYLAHLKSDAIGDGYSAQASWLWASDGRPLMAARQSVALFG